MSNSSGQKGGAFFNGRVLIVDDEPDILEILKEIVEQSSVLVFTATNGKEAMDILETKQIDVVLSDLMMPQMDGVELLREMRNKKMDLPFIFITGNPSNHLNLEALQLGAFDAIEKPFQPDTIDTLIQEALRQQESLTQVCQQIDQLVIQNTIEISKVPTAKLLTHIPAADQNNSSPPIQFDYFSELDQVFVDETIPILKRMKEDLAGVFASASPAKVFGSLSRKARVLEKGANAIGAEPIAKIVCALKEAFTYYRINNHVLTQERLDRLLSGCMKLEEKVKALVQKEETLPAAG